MASGRSRFTRMWPITEGSVSKDTCTLPAMVSATDWPEPLYGTCKMFTELAILKFSPATCGVLPAPEEPNETLSGLAFR